MSQTLMLLLAAAAFGVVGVAFVLWMSHSAKQRAAEGREAVEVGDETSAERNRSIQIETICKAFPEISEFLRAHLDAADKLGPEEIRQAFDAARAGAAPTTKKAAPAVAGQTTGQGSADNQRGSVQIETMCKAFPEFSGQLRRHLQAARKLGPDEIRQAFRAAWREAHAAGEPVSGRALTDKAALDRTVGLALPGAIEAAITESQCSDILAALRAIAGKDDGAARKDGCGFNRDHARIGNRLASLDSLTPAQADVGRDLVRFYKRQVVAADPTLFERAVAGMSPGRRDLSAKALESRLADGNTESLPPLHGPPSARRVTRV